MDAGWTVDPSPCRRAGSIPAAPTKSGRRKDRSRMNACSRGPTGRGTSPRCSTVRVQLPPAAPTRCPNRQVRQGTGLQSRQRGFKSRFGLQHQRRGKPMRDRSRWRLAERTPSEIRPRFCLAEAQDQRPCSPTGRGTGLKPRQMLVRVQPWAPFTTRSRLDHGSRLRQAERLSRSTGRTEPAPRLRSSPTQTRQK